MKHYQTVLQNITAYFEYDIKTLNVVDMYVYVKANMAVISISTTSVTTTSNSSNIK